MALGNVLAGGCSAGAACARPPGQLVQRAAAAAWALGGRCARAASSAMTMSWRSSWSQAVMSSRSCKHDTGVPAGRWGAPTRVWQALTPALQHTCPVRSSISSSSSQPWLPASRRPAAGALPAAGVPCSLAPCALAAAGTGAGTRPATCPRQTLVDGRQAAARAAAAQLAPSVAGGCAWACSTACRGAQQPASGCRSCMVWAAPVK